MLLFSNNFIIELDKKILAKSLYLIKIVIFSIFNIII